MPPTYTYVLLQLADPVGPDDAANLARELVDEVPDVCRATPARFFDGGVVVGVGFVPTAAAKPAPDMVDVAGYPVDISDMDDDERTTGLGTEYPHGEPS